MLTLQHLRAENPAVEPLRAGSALGSGALKKDIPSNFTEFHEVHVFGMLFFLESLASRISSHVKLPHSQQARGVKAIPKEVSREDESLPGEVSCAFAETRLLGVS